MAIKTAFVISAKDDASKAINGVSSNLKKLDADGSSSIDALGNAFKRLAGPIAGVATITQTFSKLVDVTREFDVLNAGLITATGSAENAKTAFSAIQQFAASTPYDLQQVTESFTKLVNYGLSPSERALTSYGNTASSMGKDLNQMIEAVADATTGEFERLKEFGIKAAKQGDEVSLTFRGVTTTIKNSADEIQNYLIGIGENEFAGAMARRMDTLDGALSNLGDAWNQLFLNVSQTGIGDAITKSVNLGIGALNNFNEELTSGKMEARLQTWTLGWRNLDNDIASILRDLGVNVNSTMDLITEYFRFAIDAWKSVWGTNLDFFLEFPNKVSVAVTTAFAHITELARNAVVTFDAIKKQLNPFDDVSIEQAASDAMRQQKELEEQRKRTITDKLASIESEKNFQLMLNSMLDDEIAKREKISAVKQEDRLAEFEIQKTGGMGAAVAGSASLSGGLRSETDIDTEAWNPVDDPEVIEMQQRIAYLRTLKDAALASDLESEELAFLNRMEMLRVRYEENEIPAEETYHRLKENLKKKHEDTITAITNKAAAARAAFEKKSLQDQSKQVFGELANITSGVAQHNKGLFELNKAAGIANAIINTYQGVSMSLAAYPMPLAAIMAAAHFVAGLAQVKAIKSTSFGGSNAGATSVGAAPVTTAPSNIANGGTPQTSQAQNTEKRPDVYINIQPNADYRGSAIRDMMERVAEEQGYNVRFGT